MNLNKTFCLKNKGLSDSLLCSFRILNCFLYTFVAASVLFFFTTSASADNVGITKARFIQKSANSYVIEADVPQLFVWAIKPPIFPDRFKVSELEIIPQAGWFIVQATASTDGEPLSPKDEVLLPWMRNGVDISARWLDGSLHQGLFLRTLEGIRVPMRMLMTTKVSLSETCQTHFIAGLKHMPFGLVHILLIGVLVLLFPRVHVVRSILYYTCGQACSLICFELGLVGLDLLFADILGLVVVVLLVNAAIRQKSYAQFLPLLFLFGLFHGVSYGAELDVLNLPADQLVPALFMFNIGLDISQLLLILLLLGIGFVSRIVPRADAITSYAIGSIAIAVLFTIFQDNVVTGKTNILPFEAGELSSQYSLPVTQNTQAGKAKPQGARNLKTPIMNYLSVEPFEVRQEVLIQARAAVQFLGVNDKGMGSIPIQSQKQVKEGILAVMQKANPILIDGEPGELILSRAEFVTMSSAGVISRPEPIVEGLDEGIIGVSLVYKTNELANRIEINWRLFSDSVQKVESATADPFGNVVMTLTPEQNQFEWKSRLSGYQIPVIEKIGVEKPKLPIPSIILFFAILALLTISLIKNKQIVKNSILLNVAAIGIIAYPFVRIPVEISIISQWTPSEERTSAILDDLLTNIYRSFEVRDESVVYDRLSLSVTGETLTDIYLENRKSLEFENRGGARATVDEVEIISINKTKAETNGYYVTDAEWVVGGSVNHFGHTHYRRNRYHAKVTFVAVDNYWKIRDIELIDEKRLL